KRRRGFRRTHVLLDEVNQRDGNENAHALGELQLEMFLLLFSLLEQLHPAEPADPVDEMDDKISLVQIEKRLDRPRFEPRLACLAEHLHPPKQLMVRE